MALKPDPCFVQVATSKKVLTTRVAAVEDMILFFPFDLAPRDCIASWTTDGRHKDVPVACVAAAWSPTTPDEVAAAVEALAMYASQNPEFPTYTVRRLPSGWELKAWKSQP